jgi:ubiquinone/menaquinone biosynthesis C-methylase UbiE
METFDRHAHWEKIYQTKTENEVSWFQSVPFTSLEFISMFNLRKDARIIDVGGCDSHLVDHLIERGYTDITVLDISETAIERAKQRLGDKASAVRWIVSDAATFVPDTTYDFWHDRAAFHFLTEEREIQHYIENVKKSINPGGILVVGTFSEEGPLKCSGIHIKQYSEQSMAERLTEYFDKVKCLYVDHQTPFNTV